MLAKLLIALLLMALCVVIHAVGVLLVGLPVSSMSGHNIAPEIGRLKGEDEALDRAAMAIGCRTGSAPAPGGRTNWPT